jgi:predicted oxidoreductase (fatty acid repression mutant protein)
VHANTKVPLAIIKNWNIPGGWILHRDQATAGKETSCGDRTFQ